MHVLGNKISVSDIDGLKPKNTDSIKSFEERRDSKGKDTFDLSDWWKSNCAELPVFVYVLCTVLTTVELTQLLPSWESL